VTAEGPWATPPRFSRRQLTQDDADAATAAIFLLGHLVGGSCPLRRLSEGQSVGGGDQPVR
jgi:hypothetical protein